MSTAAICSISRYMSDGFRDIEKFENDPRGTGDNFRANSKLSESDYFVRCSSTSLPESHP